MSAPTNVTVQVACPMHVEADSRFRCGEAVTADYGTFASTTIEVAPCSSLLAQGWTGPQMVLRKSDEARLCGVEAPPAVRHAEGLVVFG